MKRGLGIGLGSPVSPRNRVLGRGLTYGVRRAARSARNWAGLGWAWERLWMASARMGDQAVKRRWARWPGRAWVRMDWVARASDLVAMSMSWAGVKAVLSWMVIGNCLLL